MKLTLQILLILLIIATFSICAIKPDLHKNFIVYDSDYTLVSEQEVKTETNNVPVMEMPAKPIQKTVTVEKKTYPTVKTTQKYVSNVQTTKTTPKKTTTTSARAVKTQKQTTATQNKTTVAPKIQTVSKPVTTTVVKPVTSETKRVEYPKVEQKIISKPLEQPKVMTQQEETIAWNKWRSALTNKIMQDTKLPDLPNGVLFQFSFNVDKYGKITNVQTGANPANYTPYAIQYIAPVIRSYQGRSILNFPEGTARTSTQVTGKWRISTTEKYSTPQDYNDVERVIH